MHAWLPGSQPVSAGNIVVIAVQCQELTEHSLEMKQMYHVLEVVRD